jgi:hypothetical protein
MSGRTIREVLAALGVIGSLVFVGLELRQNTAAVQGATLQAISDSYTGFLHTNSLDPEYREVERLVFRGALMADLTDEQNHLIATNVIAWVGMLENMFVQNRLGLVSDLVFEGYGWNRRFHQTPYFREWWELFAHAWVSEEFGSFFESRVQVGPSP